MSGAWPAENRDRPEFLLPPLQAAIEEGRDETPLVEAVKGEAAVDGLRWAPIGGVVLLNCRKLVPRSTAGSAAENTRPPRGAVAGTRDGRGHCGLLLSFILATARTAEHRRVRRVSWSTGDQGRLEDMISSPASSNWAVERTGAGHVISALRARKGKFACPSLGVTPRRARPLT